MIYLSNQLTLLQQNPKARSPELYSFRVNCVPLLSSHLFPPPTGCRKYVTRSGSGLIQQSDSGKITKNFNWNNGPRVSQDSAVGIATGYGLDDRGVGVRVPVESRIFSSPRRRDRLWGPPSLLSNGYRGLFLRG
jgi:hypothetical protein